MVACFKEEVSRHALKDVPIFTRQRMRRHAPLLTYIRQNKLANWISYRKPLTRQRGSDSIINEGGMFVEGVSNPQPLGVNLGGAGNC
jgi:hypothetical protein